MDIVSPDPSPGKMCEHCNVLQPLKQFHKNSSWCRTCFRVARKEAPPGKKMCTHCKEVKDLDAFKQDILWNKVRIASWCKPCAVEHARLRTLRTYDYQDHREAHLWHKYDGMTQAVYDAMLEVQGGVCACCHQPETVMKYGKLMTLAVDHCHRLDAVRGLLCKECNTALGLMKEDPERVLLLLKYIEERCL